MTPNKLLLEFHSPSGNAVVQVRSTLLQSSLQTLREHGLFQRYAALLPKKYHEPILLTLAPTWLPVDVAMAHYEACDQLSLDDAALQRFGETVASQIMGTFLGTIARSSRNVGASPLLVVRNYDRLWARLFLGGGVTIREVGPKDVSIETYGVPMYALHYFRIAHLGVVKGTLGMFAKQLLGRMVYPFEHPSRGGQPALQTFISWV
jgi:hypothetical protein